MKVMSTVWANTSSRAENDNSELKDAEGLYRNEGNSCDVISLHGLYCTYELVQPCDGL